MLCMKQKERKTTNGYVIEHCKMRNFKLNMVESDAVDVEELDDLRS